MHAIAVGVRTVPPLPAVHNETLGHHNQPARRRAVGGHCPTQNAGCGPSAPHTVARALLARKHRQRPQQLAVCGREKVRPTEPLAALRAQLQSLGSAPPAPTGSQQPQRRLEPPPRTLPELRWHGALRPRAQIAMHPLHGARLPPHCLNSLHAYLLQRLGQRVGVPPLPNVLEQQQALRDILHPLQQEPRAVSSVRSGGHQKLPGGFARRSPAHRRLADHYCQCLGGAENGPLRG
mmetsp:Transcript_115358/g.204425  ORF Transcript_115358/g.204425 Transcript_115358/m.204425 type:complete len:235 (+) Transcript_115358:746-1450(+)